MKISLFILFSLILMPQESEASLYGKKKEIYLCSNNKNYAVIIFYAGGWGSETRKFVSMCESKIARNFQDWSHLNPPENAAIESACEADEAEETINCGEEFQVKNFLDDQGNLKTKMDQGR